MSNRFCRFIEASPPWDPLLPLTHTCDAFDFRGIMEEKKLLTHECPVFSGEALVYCFYGRPAYRPSRTKQATSIPAYMPVSIILTPDSVQTPKRIFPFDTGAFNSKLFENHMHPHMKINDFLLEPSQDLPGRCVKRFFGSNNKYFHGEPNPDDIPSLEFEALSYYSLISEKGISGYDDRRSTIEIQSDNSIILTRSNVLLVVLPTIFLDDDKVQQTIVGEWGADVRTYSIHHGNPNEYVRLIYHEVEQYLQMKDYI